MDLMTSPPPARQKPGRHDKREKREKHHVEQALAELLAAFSAHERPLSPWERHCLWGALTFLRFGYFDQAFQRIGDVLDPRLPLPAFPPPRPLTLDDVRSWLSSAHYARAQ